MKKRQIKPEFWSSKTLSTVPREVRLFFIGLWNHADDEGRLLAHPNLLAASLFPNDEDVDAKVVRGWLEQLELRGKVERYEVDGRPYVALPNFREHQKWDKRYESKLPAPPSERTAAPAVVPVAPAAESAGHAAHPVAPAAHPASSPSLQPLLQPLTATAAAPPSEGPSLQQAKPSAPPSGSPRPPGQRYASRLPHEMELWRDTASELLAMPDPYALFGDSKSSGTFGQRLADTYPAYDGERGRPSLLMRVEAEWPSFEKKFFNHGPKSALPALLVWLHKGYESARGAWSRDGNVEADALRTKGLHFGQVLRPADDDDDIGGAHGRA